MSSNIFLVHDNGELLEMQESQYDSEDRLQELLATHPNLLAGDQMNREEPRRWVLVSREVGLPSEEGGIDRWSVDHLFLDQDGIPTIVEVKRSSDTRIRREVIGQMLEYAANAVTYWPLETLRSRLEATCAARGIDPAVQLTRLLAGTTTEEQFWEAVQTNLQAGRVRMVFVADVIPSELRRVVEFLNSQMNPAEVLAVEVRQYAGPQQRVLVPRVIGQTEQAVARKTSGRASGRQWDEASFLETLEAKTDAAVAGVARRMIAWGKELGLRLWWGRGRFDGSCYLILDHDSRPNWTYTIWTNGDVMLEMRSMKNTPYFADPEMRLALIRKLNEIPGVAMSEDRKDGIPSFPIAVLAEDQSLQRFLGIFEEIIRDIRAGPGEEQRSSST